MPSTRYIGSRLLQAVISIFAVISFTFVLIRWMPGSAKDHLLAQMMSNNVDADRVRVMMGAYNLHPDKPLLQQYIHYMVAILHGDLGRSISYQESVLKIVGQAMPWTIYLSLISMVLIFGIGIAFGAYMAYQEGGRFDVGSSIFWIVVESLPYYVFAIGMLWFFSFTTGIFPIGNRFGTDVVPGFNPPFILSILYHSTLPILSLVITGIGGITLSMRGNSIQVLGEDYLRVARLRGLSEEVISLRYVGRNAILPMYTSMMISMGYLFGGSVILEKMFNYTGMGYYMLKAVNARDYPLMMGTFLFITIGVILGVTIADLTYGYIDPRASSESSNQRRPSGSVLSALRSLPHTLASMGEWFVVKANTVASGMNIGSGTGSESGVSGGAQPTAAEGGGGLGNVSATNSPFHTVSDVTVSRRERYWNTLDGGMLAPLRVLWSDMRARVGLIIIGIYVLMGVVAVVSSSNWWVFSGITIVNHPHALEGPQLLPPFKSMAHPLGTTDMGHDLFEQVVYATPSMFKMMAGGAIFATAMALVWGVVAGYAGGALDRVMMTIADVLMSIPGLPLVIVLTTIFHPHDPFLVGVLLVVNAWAGFSRALRAQVLTIRRESYVEASQTMDIAGWRILVFDIIPGLMPLVMVNFVTRARAVIVTSVGLYFLGLLPFTTLNWGVMLNMAYSSGTWYNMDNIYWIAVPILTIMIISLGLILFGQGCDRIFNPRIRARHAKHTSDDGPSPTDEVATE